MFTIGAFSRLAQLSIRVLRHYDEIGLLEPAHITKATGYRYYAAEQLADAHRIVALKELGLNLEQVQRLMKEEHSLESLAGMLHLERARAEQERAEAEKRLRDLDRRLSELQDLGRLSDVDVVEKSVPELPFLSLRTTVAQLADAYTLMNDIVARCAEFGPWSPFLAVAHDSFFDTERLDLELGYPVASPQVVELDSTRSMRVRQLPAVERVLSVVYVGTQEDGHLRSHHAIARWLEHHRCDLAGPGRELIHGPLGANGQTIELQYPIAPLAL